MRVDNRRPRAVQHDRAADVAGRGAVDVATVEDEIGGHLGQGGVTARRFQGHQDVVGGARRGPRRRDLDTDEPEVVRGSRRADRRHRVGAHDLRHEIRLRRADTSARRGQARERRALHVDPAAAALGRKGEVAAIGRAGLQDDRVAGLRRVEGALKIAAGRNAGLLARRRSVRRVESHLRELRRLSGKRRRRPEQREGQGQAEHKLPALGHGDLPLSIAKTTQSRPTVLHHAGPRLA